MNKFKTRTLLASALLGLTVSAGPAQADLFAISQLVIEDFVASIDDGNGGLRPLDYGTAANDYADSDFGLDDQGIPDLTFTSSADMDGVLTGTGGFDFDTPNTTSGEDFPVSCLSTTGDCNPIADNNDYLTTPLPALITGPQGEDYVAADQKELNSPISNLPGYDPVPGADVGSIAIGSLSTTVAEGSANVNNGLESNWTFALDQTGGLTLSGAIYAYLEAFASGDEQPDGKAAAAYSFSITIEDLQGGLGLVFDSGDLAAFDLLNEVAAANANDNFDFDQQSCGNLNNLAGPMTGCGTALSIPDFSVTTGELLADNFYQLTIRGNTNIDIAREVEGPEPSILALLGLGFLGMSLGRRRRG